jgi:hypothetical protein
VTALRCLIALLTLAGPVKAQTAVPDPTLTPGVVSTTDAADVCSHGTNPLRHMSHERSDAIMAEYSLPGGRDPDYEIDHLIPLGIGGADSVANLWPEPLPPPSPASSGRITDRLTAPFTGAYNNIHSRAAVALAAAHRAASGMYSWGEQASDATGPPRGVGERQPGASF